MLNYFPVKELDKCRPPGACCACGSFHALRHAPRPVWSAPWPISSIFKSNILKNIYVEYFLYASYHIYIYINKKHNIYIYQYIIYIYKYISIYIFTYRWFNNILNYSNYTVESSICKTWVDSTWLMLSTLEMLDWFKTTAIHDPTKYHGSWQLGMLETKDTHVNWYFFMAHLNRNTLRFFYSFLGHLNPKATVQLVVTVQGTTTLALSRRMNSEVWL